MKIIITGACGQLGTELRKILKDEASELGAIPISLQKAQVVNVDLPHWDIGNREHVEKLLEQEKPQLIINCAAYTNVDGCEKEPDLAFRVNAIGPKYLAQACAKWNTALMHLSTDYVFSGDAVTPRSEWDIPDPQSVYGFSKRLGEEYISKYCSRSFVVRTAWLYGYHGNNFVKTILKLAREKDKLIVVDDQCGNPTNAVDLAYHLLKIAAAEDYGLYHCTNNGVCSWFEFATEFVRQAGLNCKIEPCTTADFPRPAKRPAFSSLENRMLRCTVGDEMRDWKDAITAYMKHYNYENGEIEQ